MAANLEHFNSYRPCGDHPEVVQNLWSDIEPITRRLRSETSQGGFMLLNKTASPYTRARRLTRNINRVYRVATSSFMSSVIPKVNAAS